MQLTSRLKKLEHQAGIKQKLPAYVEVLLQEFAAESWLLLDLAKCMCEYAINVSTREFITINEFNARYEGEKNLGYCWLRLPIVLGKEIEAKYSYSDIVTGIAWHAVDEYLETDSYKQSRLFNELVK